MTIVAPISSSVRFPLNPVHVLLPANRATGLDVNSVALLNQIRAIDPRRLIKRLGVASDALMAQVDEAIRICLGLVDLS
jgi:mRNA interferase MazF